MIQINNPASEYPNFTLIFQNLVEKMGREFAALICENNL